MPRLEICGAKATQTAVPELNQPEKTLYYLIIGEEPNKVVINVGQKTYEKINRLCIFTEEPAKDQTPKEIEIDHKNKTAKITK